VANAVRTAVITGLVLLAAVLDSVVLAPLDLPGAAPSLLILVVASWSLVVGPAAGAVTGFAAGLAADVLPPADHLLGRYALVLCIAGYLAGLLREEARDSVPVALLAVTFAVAVGTVLYAGSGIVFGDSRVGAHDLTSSVPFSVGYDVLLAPFVAPGVIWLAKRTQPTVART
jgi:rod shape-determining protein MreD